MSAIGLSLLPEQLTLLSDYQRSALLEYSNFLCSASSPQSSTEPQQPQPTLNQPIKKGLYLAQQLEGAYEQKYDLLIIATTVVPFETLYTFVEAVSTYRASLSLVDTADRALFIASSAQFHTKRSVAQWIYHHSAQFWFRLFSRRTLLSPTSSLKAYSIGWTQSCKAPIVPGVGYEQELLLRAFDDALLIQEVPVKTVALQKVSVIELIPLIALYTRALFRHIKGEFSYGSFEGKGLFSKIHNVVMNEVKAHIDPKKAALALGVGVFWGLTPFHGFQVVAGFVTALRLRLNRPLTFVGLNVSFAPFLVVLIPFATKVGEVILQGSITEGFKEAMARGDVGFLWSEGLMGIKYYLVGSLVMAPVGALLTFGFTYVFFLLVEMLYDRSLAKKR